MQTYLAFFGYSRDDDDIVRSIVRHILVPVGPEQSAAIRVWRDMQNMQPGENRQKAIVNASITE